MLKRILLLHLYISLVSLANAQMTFGGQKLFGNEWLDRSLTHYKFKVSEDGIYRINYNTLVAAGIPVSQVRMDVFAIYNLGSEISIYTSTNGIMGPNDYIEFYAKKNRGELDKALFPNPADQFNELYSLYTDEASYFFTIKDAPSTQRVKSVMNDVSNPLPKDQYLISTETKVYTNISNKRSQGIQSEEKFPDFDASQGYSTKFVETHNIDVEFKNLYKNNIPAKIELTYAGKLQDATSHKVVFSIDDVEVDVDNFSGFKVRHNVLNILPSDLKNKFNLKLISQRVIGEKDEIAVSNIKYTFPKTFNFDNSKYSHFAINASPIRKYLELENFDGGSEIRIYDLTNQTAQTSAKSGAIYKVSLEPSIKEREIIVFNTSEIKTINSFEKISYADYKFSDPSIDYVILTSKKFKQLNQGAQAVADYINYRSSTDGGAYKIAEIHVEDLYNDFGFGIQYHSIALRNFFQYARKQWPKLKYVLIIGKGLDYPTSRNNKVETDEYMFVPSYSYPAADYLMISDSTRNPFCALGRIPAISAKEAMDYLTKVKEHESYLRNTSHNIKDREWIKQVMHLSGGDTRIYSNLENQLNSMKDIIENNQFGATVTTFKKQSSAPVEIADIDALRNRVNSGVSLITFLGHSAAFKLDFNVESVNSYSNKGKYHVFVAMGCYAGQMFQGFRSVSEQFNLPSDKGSIIYLSNTTAGIPNVLGLYGSEFYNSLGGKYYGASIGELSKAVNTELLKINSESAKIQALSLSFNGDPAIHMFTNPDQDFTIDAATLATDPKSIFSSQDSFNFSFDILNLGKSYKDSVLVKIETQLPNGKKQIVYQANVSSPIQRKNYQFKLPTYGDAAIGFNKIFVTLDPNNTIAEGPSPVAEQNNEIALALGDKCYTYYLIGNDARPVYPEEFSIVTQDLPVLIANNGNTLAKFTNYYLEIDTTEYFNSPLKSAIIKNQTGGVIQWETGLRLIPSKVYYWRVRPEITNANVDPWRSSSFVYLPQASKGWNQSHFFQFKKDDFQGKQLKESSRVFNYSEQVTEFRVINSFISDLPPYSRPQIFYQGDIHVDYIYWKLRPDLSGVVIMAMDPVSGKFITNATGKDYGSDGNSEPLFKDSKFFLFETHNKTSRDEIINFLENIIPKGHVIIFNTLRQANYSFYPEQWAMDGSINLYSYLTSVGATKINDLKTRGSLPYSLVYRKNVDSFALKEILGDTINTLELPISFKSNRADGRLYSTTIGPASSWEKFLWDFNRYNSNEDKQYVNIYGIKNNGTETKLFGPITAADQDLRNVNKDSFPKIKLEWYSEDSTTRTAPNLDYWRIHYEGFPDIAYNPTTFFKKNKDTLDQGEKFQCEIFAQNISNYDFDSLLVKFDLIDERNTIITSVKRFIPVKAFAGIKIPYEISTNGQRGKNKLVIELNPNQDQKEPNTFNNVAIIEYYVRGDNRNPLLDVVFDGIHIANNDIVSSKSKITITLSDENANLLLNDTSLFDISIRLPDKSLRKISLHEKDVTFIPASGGGKNQATVIICGDFIKDGTYELIIKAKDKSGNTANVGDYIISFKIVNEQSVSNLFNYPNPFTTKTRFVYTLTGAELPSYYRIQIMTISGKVVKEISQQEIGKLKIGSHMTDYEYDGSDDFGSKLANGVYLYRFIIKNAAGEDFKKLDVNKLDIQNTDQFFKNNLGKMVIIR